MRIILATHNPGKAKQIKEIFSGSPFDVLTLNEANITGEAPEDYTTLEANARQKILYAKDQAPDDWIMADDTGIFIKTLGGAPGVHSKRWAGEDATDQDIMNFTLAKMVGVTDRSAIFRTVVVLVGPNGEEQIFSGERAGQLLEVPRCAPKAGMPYSSIFLADGAKKTWAEMETEEMNVGSHRGKAFRQALEFLKQRV